MEQLTFGDEPGGGFPKGARASATGYEIERELAARGTPVVAGVDEVGRGAWAGRGGGIP